MAKAIGNIRPFSFVGGVLMEALTYLFFVLGFASLFWITLVVLIATVVAFWGTHGNWPWILGAVILFVTSLLCNIVRALNDDDEDELDDTY